MDVGGNEIGDARQDDDGRVEEGYLAAGGFGFGQGLKGVGLVKEDLALKVGWLYEVAVDEGECANAGTGEERCGRGSCGSTADDGDVGGGEELLPRRAYAGKEDLAGVAVVIGDGGAGWSLDE